MPSYLRIFLTVAGKRDEGGKTYVERRWYGRVTISAESLTSYAMVSLLAAPYLLRLQFGLDYI